eukprot:TRINITY_DN754_c0_g1_i3.p1 TRINITY_DN754_c0_g1~~TRINITY_DN754_c0_g1_i3.p1  ORF type:complete len:231 (-),score=42.67 TRINITY_DN754_c0_g1_i3:460-1152(-)
MSMLCYHTMCSATNSALFFLQKFEIGRIVSNEASSPSSDFSAKRRMDRTVFTFGKHKGKTFKHVTESDPGYCEWAKKQDAGSSGLAGFQEYLEFKEMKMQRAGEHVAATPPLPKRARRMSPSHSQPTFPFHFAPADLEDLRAISQYSQDSSFSQSSTSQRSIPITPPPYSAAASSDQDSETIRGLKLKFEIVKWEERVARINFSAELLRQGHNIQEAFKIMDEKFPPLER